MVYKQSMKGKLIKEIFDLSGFGGLRRDDLYLESLFREKEERGGIGWKDNKRGSFGRI